MGKSSISRRLALLFSVILLAGCESIMLSAMSVGASTGISYAMNGFASRTFTAPVSEVREASVLALALMELKVSEEQIEEQGTYILAESGEYRIEVFLEPISENTTRVRTLVNESWTLDRATAEEIIAQTEMQLRQIAKLREREPGTSQVTNSAAGI